MRNLGPPTWILSAFIILFFTALPCLFGQDAVGTGPNITPASATTPASAATSTEGASLQQLQSAPSSSILDSNARPVTDIPRRFHFNFQLTVRGVYDDNINLAQTHTSDDFYTSIEPRISLGLGGAGEDQTNSLNFVYAPNAYIFAKQSNADALQHVIHLDAQRQFAKLTLSASEDIQILDSSNLTSLTDTTGRQANVDVGQRTREDIFNTVVGGSYDLSSKTFLSGSVTYQVYRYPSLISSETVTGALFINYNYGAKVVFGIGGSGGYDTAGSSTPDQYFEQGNLRISYQATGKINFAATAGYEVRQFADNARGNYTSPVFTLSAGYQPFDGTSVSLTGDRSTRNSAVVSGGDFASTKIDFGVRQRLLRRAFLGFNIGYENDNYFSAVSGVDVSRDDDYYYVQSSLDVNVTRFWTVGAYYLHREDSSSLQSFRFSDNQFGARTTITF